MKNRKDIPAGDSRGGAIRRKAGAWSEAAMRVLRERYLLRDSEGVVTESADDMAWRVARAVAEAEKQWKDPNGLTVDEIATQFYDVMVSRQFLPNSPTLMNAGKGNNLQLSACYVVPVPDSLEGIFDAVKHAALIHQSGGGTGFSFSRLRPEGSMVASTRGVASGPVSFMKIFDGATEAVKQGGCVTPDTRVSTSAGMVRIGTLGPLDAEPKSWHALRRPLSAATDEGQRRVEEFYHNGVAAVRRIRTTAGYQFTGTWEHRVRVIDETGAYVWRHLKDLRAGDWVALQKHTYPETTDYQFPPFDRVAHPNATPVRIPERPTAELGEFIGYFVGDGSVNYYNSGHTTGRLTLTVADADPEVGERLLRLARDLFGVTPQEHRKPDDASVTYFFNATELVAWLKHIGVTKSSALTAHVPEIVFQAGAEFARGFLRGLFTADGTISSDGYSSLCSVSRELIEDAQQLLLALGVPTSISVTTNRESAFGDNPVYRLRVMTSQGLREFAGHIGFISTAKTGRLAAGLEKAWEFNDVLPHQEAAVAAIYQGPGRGSGPERSSRGANRGLYRDLQHYMPGVSAPRHLTRSRLLALAEKHDEVRDSALALFLTNGQFYDQVVEIAEDEALTVDLSVEENHTYIANGFVSHNTRRGANMGILRVDHPDVLKFIDCKRDGSVTNFNISVAITDEFMRAYEADMDYALVDPHTKDEVRRLKAREVMARIVDAAWATGDPGLVFLDRANRSSANPTPEIELLEATNPCVIGETRLATSRGLIRMDTLYASGEDLAVTTDARSWEQASERVVNGAAQVTASGVTLQSAAPVFKTGEQVPVRKLVTSHGIEITATPNHRFLTTEGYKRLDQLEYGDTLLLQSAEGVWSTTRELPEIVYGVRSQMRLGAWERSGKATPPREWSCELGELVGYILGDGYLRFEPQLKNQYVLGVAISTQDSAIVETIQQRLRVWFGVIGNVTERQGHYQFQTAGAVGAFFHGLGLAGTKAHEKRVPESIFTAPRDAVIGFLRGLFSADGSVQIGTVSGSCSVRLATSSKGLALDVQQMLLNLGIVSAIRLRREAGVTLLPNARREMTEYATQAQYEVIIDKANRDRFAEVIGFMQPEKQARLVEWIGSKKRVSTREEFTTKVALIEDAGVADVYDTTVAEVHSMVVNGLATHNCGEQWLGPYDACNLGSINLGLFIKDGEVDWLELERVTRLTTRFLDDVIEINPFPLSQVAEKVHANRRIGLGVMGWAEMLFEFGLRYDSEDATALGERVMNNIREWSSDESSKMAEVRGAFPNFERSIYKTGRPLRNATRTTVAPTGSISILADCSSGIEPIFALAFQHRVKQPDGSYRVLDFVNPFFQQALEASDIEDKAGVLEYAKTHGSLHGHAAESHAALKPYVTAHEIAPEWHIRMQAAFQKGVDNSISKCIAAGTLIPTSRGLMAVEDFSGVEEPDTFVDIATEGITTGGHRILSHYYAGEKLATRIRLDSGAELTGSTESHRVLTPSGWTRMADLRVGDLVVGRFERSHGQGGALLPPAGPYLTNAKPVTIPERMSAPLAQFLGMLAADGHTTLATGAVGLTSADEEVLGEFKQLAERLFGLTPRFTVEKRNERVRYLTINSRTLCRWVRDLIGEGAYGKRVPTQIIGGSEEEKLAFLRGISLDGYHHPQYGLYVYAGMSERLAYGVAEMCRSFGLPLVRVHHGIVAQTGGMSYKVLISNELQERVTCIERHKNGPAHYATYQTLVQPELVAAASVSTSHPYYSAFRSIRQREALNCDNRTADRLGWSSETPVHRVTAVEDAGMVSLYDIEVEDAHEYVVNGIVSHNTINLPNQATREDVSKAYMQAWSTGCLGITIFRDGSKGEQVLNVGVKGAQLAAAPAPSAEDLAKAAAAEALHKRYKGGRKNRPEVMSGYTRQVRAPEGKVNVTLNGDDEGLLEVFINIGKAGSDVAALAEALGRLISIHLQIESPLTQNERAREVAHQLRSIGGSTSIGFGENRVRSLPDAVARALELYLAELEGRGARVVEAGAPHAISAPNGAAPREKPADLGAKTRFTTNGNLCPSCGNTTMYYEEGCKKCVSCGYSEC